jgi:hypothetical protein
MTGGIKREHLRGPIVWQRHKASVLAYFQHPRLSIAAQPSIQTLPRPEGEPKRQDLSHDLHMEALSYF